MFVVVDLAVAAVVLAAVAVVGVDVVVVADVVAVAAVGGDPYCVVLVAYMCVLFVQGGFSCGRCLQIC